MPQHKQFEKSIKQQAKSALRNKAAKSRVNTVVKKVSAATTHEEAEKALQSAASVLDSTARKGIITKKAAARKKSRLAKRINKMA